MTTSRRRVQEMNSVRTNADLLIALTKFLTPVVCPNVMIGAADRLPLHLKLGHSLPFRPIGCNPCPPTPLFPFCRLPTSSSIIHHTLVDHVCGLVRSDPNVVFKVRAMRFVC